VDIIVYAHDDDNRVGVRALYYKDSDPWEDEPIGDEWIPFCDFTGDLPSPGDADVVYAFQRDLAGNDVLTDPITGSRMWYIVTNTTETANSFDDTGAWHTPLVSEGMTISKRVWIKAVDAVGNEKVESVVVDVVPEDNLASPAAFWVEGAPGKVRAAWSREAGPRAIEYRVWLQCRAMGRTLVATVDATARGESGEQAYSVEIPAGVECAEGVYELEAVTEGYGPMPLAWAVVAK
jgi:hypothetical protein